jgi:di/tricarboxylate transporter
MSKYIIVLLTLLLIGGYIYHKNTLSLYNDKIRTIDIENKKRLKMVRDSLHHQIDTVATYYEKKFDSIATSPLKVKYIYYEKPVYVNRTIDDAISIIADYEYNNEGAKKDTLQKANSKKDN